MPRSGRKDTIHRSFRLAASLVNRLAGRAEEVGTSASALAERYIDEGLRMDEHPLIVFRDGAAGRRAALAGTRLDVWQVVETVKHSESDVRKASGYLEISERSVRACLRYYGAYRDEVDRFTERQHATAAREEELWRGEQAVLA